MKRIDIDEEEMNARARLAKMLNQIRERNCQRTELISAATNLATEIDRKYSRNVNESVVLWQDVRRSTWV